MTDNHRALAMLDCLAIDSDFMRFTTFNGPPSGNSRAIFERRGGRLLPSPKRIPLRNHLLEIFKEPLVGNLAMGCVFFRPNNQRIDVDNMLKHVSDAATGVAWLDDSQVTAVMGIAELDAEKPRTLIMIARHYSSLIRDRGAERTCEECGAVFVPSTSKPQRLCSLVCRSAWQIKNNHKRQKREWMPCIDCGG